MSAVCNSYEVFTYNIMHNDTLDLHPDNMFGHLFTNATSVDTGELVLSHIRTFQTFLALAVNLVNHCTIALVTIAMVYKCYMLDFEKTALHAYLCTLGFVFMMAEGVMVRYKSNIFYSTFSPEIKTLFHALLQFVGGTLGLMGSMQKYWGKAVHFKSRHGKLGIAACALWFLNLMLGISVLIFPNLGGTWLRLLHSSLGTATFVIVMLAQIYGYDTGFFRRNFTRKHLWKFATFVILVCSLMGPLKKLSLTIEARVALWLYSEDKQTL